MGARSFYVYILANRIGGTLYIGVTNDLVRRVSEHKSNVAKSFTKRHDVNRLVHFECFDDIEQAIRREKRLKKWTRAWKISLIEKDNPNWTDIFTRKLREDDGPLTFSTERALEYWVARSSRAMTAVVTPPPAACAAAGKARTRLA
jgi:putative endonuclease